MINDREYYDNLVEIVAPIIHSAMKHAKGETVENNEEWKDVYRGRVNFDTPKHMAPLVFNILQPAVRHITALVMQLNDNK